MEMPVYIFKRLVGPINAARKARLARNRYLDSSNACHLLQQLLKGE